MRSLPKKPQKKAVKTPGGISVPTGPSKRGSANLKRVLRPVTGGANPTDLDLPGSLAEAALAGNPAAMAFMPDVDTAPAQYAGLDASGSVSLLRRIQAISRWRDFLDPLAGFSAAKARSLAEDYTRGWMADLQWTYFFLEWTNPDLFALVDRRTSRLLEMDYTIKISQKATDRKQDAGGEVDPAAGDAPGGGDEVAKGLKSLAQEQEQALRERFDKIDNLYEAIEHLAMASFRGYAHAEKWYDELGNLNHLEIVDQWNVVRDGLRGGWKYNPRAWQTGYFGLDDSLKIDPANFVIREVRRHIDRIALAMETSRRLTNVDWDAFGEIYGIPSGVIIGPPNVQPGSAAMASFLAAAQEISQGGSGALPYGAQYIKNDLPRGDAPFKTRLEFLTEKLVLVGTGGALTMLTRSGSGTLAGGAHAEVFEQLAKAEARKISEILNRQVTNDWLDEDFPGQPKLAYFAMASEEETKLGEIVAHVQVLSGAGYQVDPGEVSERTGYTVTLKSGSAGSGQPKSLSVDGRNADPETGDPANLENRRRMLNRAGYDAGAAVFDRNARRKLNAAQAQAMGPLLDRIAALKDIPADELGDAVQKLRDDLPRLYAEARLQSPDVANVWDDVLGTALVDGLADRPSTK